MRVHYNKALYKWTYGLQQYIPALETEQRE